ncbi:LuxR C-terminal-related transcriptional regulator [Kribbella sp. CA-247076]|uniref:LuxR C-terminal-related transcriptional regulator n=1 Tax=Kribbella sp. CA-247076 TaxID=3239941 RepID=UPI003D8D922A
MPRDRLRTALDRGARSPLTLLIAPAGTGKTVLLSDWVARRAAAGEPTVWVTGQEPEALEELLHQVVAAANGPDTEVVPAAAPSAPEEPAGPPVPVVIDDAHLLPARVLATLTEILHTAPEAVRLLVASRFDLPLPAAELELRGLASTLRARDLRFKDAEVAALVHAHAGSATDRDVQLLQQRTAGWAAALVLAARTLATSAGSGLTGAPVLTEQPVLDLLLGETFRTLDRRVQDVLLSTFRSTPLTGQRARVLSGDADAGTLLADLASSGLLVTAYAGEPGGEPVYRYHPLLIELLRRRVMSDSEGGHLVTAAHHRAATYHENRGQGGAALRDALGADDPALVARVLLSYGPGVLCSGDLSLVVDAFEVLPDGYLDDHPYLLGVRGLLRRLTGDLTGAVMDAASAEATHLAAPASRDTGNTSPHDALQVDLLILRLWQSRFGWYDVHEAIDRSRSVVLNTLATDGRRQVVVSPDRLSWLLIELAAAETWAGELDDALGHLDEALVTARMSGHAHLLAGGLAHRAVLHYLRGATRTAAKAAQAALESAGADSLAEEYAVRAHAILGLAAWCRLDLPAAERWQRLVEAAGAAGSDSVVAALRLILRVLVLTENGQLDEARSELTTDPATIGPLPQFLIRDLTLLRLWVAILVGDRSTVDSELLKLDDTGSGPDAEVVRALSSVVLGDDKATLHAVDAALAKPGIHPILVASATAFEAVLYLRLGDEFAADQALVDGLNLVAPQRSLQALTAAGREPEFVDLLRRHTRAPGAHPFAAAALDSITGYHPGWGDAGGRTLLERTRRSDPVPSPRQLDAVINGARIRLTAREADVLDQLALGSSYTEIAQALFITENTVKTHLMSLYRKLGVDKRSAALRVARGVDLL